MSIRKAKEALAKAQAEQPQNTRLQRQLKTALKAVREESLKPAPGQRRGY